jgi:glycosyltransferase involved in cell wall biosynthesis
MAEKFKNSSDRKKKKLWILTELYYPENNQTGYYITRIGEGLTTDFDVKVICGQPNYAVRGTVAPKHEIHKDVEIFRVRGTTLDKNVLLFRLMNMITHGWSVFFNALFKIKKSDEVLTVSAPPSLPFLSALAAKIKGVEYSVIIHDKYPEILIAVKKTKSDSFFIKFFNRLNRWLYSNAKKIIVVGRDMEDVVREQLKQRSKPDKKIAVIPNWAALEEIEPRPKKENELLKKLGIADKFIFLYAGNMGHPQDVESIIECAGKLKDHDEIRFIFIGGGVKRKWVETEIEKNDLTNVFLLDPMPREKQSDFLNACDVGFVSLVKKMYGVAMPSRTYNLLAAGKPILALTEKNSEVERIVSEENVGWTIPPQNSELLLETILEIYEGRSKLEQFSETARKAAVLKCNAENSIEKYRQVLSSASDNELPV